MKKIFKVTQHESKTLSWWYSRRSKIDMNPSYQRRGKLWSDTDKAYLIDSILNGYDIPKIYVADFTWRDTNLNKSQLPYAIIDGKQRFEAIFDFYDGNITLNDDFICLDDPELQLGGLGYKDLQSNYKEIADNFDTYNLTVMSVIASDEKQINELFVRLNRSKPLTGAEMRNAMTGLAPEMIRQITKHEFFSDNIKFEITRGQDLNAAAKLLLFEYHKNVKDTTKTELDNFVKETQKTSKREQLELAGRYVLDNLTVLSDIFLPKDKLLNSAGIIPVYYWFIRNISDKYHPFARKFLLKFEDKRKENRRLVKEEPNSNKIESKFVEYDNYNRSTNNEQSHGERVRILSETFKAWQGELRKR